MRMGPTITIKNTLYIVGALLLASAAYAIGSHAHFATPVGGLTKLEAAQKTLAAGDGQQALALFTPLAKKGNAQADYWIADIYANGIGVAPDQTKAIAYLKKAADKGLVKAEARLGRLYASGMQTVQNFNKANTWLSKAALHGNAASERGLGRLYQQGLGVTRNPVAAYAWYENAVLRGDSQAVKLRNRVVASLPPQALAKAEAKAKALNAEIDKTA